MTDLQAIRHTHYERISVRLKLPAVSLVKIKLARYMVVIAYRDVRDLGQEIYDVYVVTSLPGARRKMEQAVRALQNPWKVYDLNTGRSLKFSWGAHVFINPNL